MALPSNRMEREFGKFVETDAGNVAIRLAPVSGTGATASSKALMEKEMGKFVEQNSAINIRVITSTS